MAELRPIDAPSLTAPHVFSGLISEWPALKWSPEFLRKHFGAVLTRARFHPRDDGEGSKIAFESDCLYQELSLAEFCHWVSESQDNIPPALAQLRTDEFWGYIDYKYFPEVFADSPELAANSLDWTVFGVDQDTMTSTFWFGSAGAYTPCHYDTYGFNLVAQLSGRKRWTLFPPSATPCLYPTRIPYEESSVYSSVNIRDPDYDKHPLFRDAVPTVIELRPGDVLCVPRHWWHFVETLEPAISVNIWVDLPTDSEERVREALVRVLACSLLSADSGTSDTDEWLNPTEDNLPHEQNMQLLNLALRDRATDSNVPEVSTRDLVNALSTSTVLDAVIKSLGQCFCLVGSGENTFEPN